MGEDTFDDVVPACIDTCTEIDHYHISAQTIVQEASEFMRICKKFDRENGFALVFKRIFHSRNAKRFRKFR